MTRSSHPVVRPVTPLHRSVFVRLVFVMVGMAVSLLVVVSAFFGYMVGPSLDQGIDPILREYTRSVAATSPDLARAREIVHQLNVHVRHEGPSGNWTTDDRLPSAADVRDGRTGHRLFPLLSRNFYLVDAPDGGSYVFAWSLGRHIQDAHTAMLIALLGVMVGVIVAAHVVIRRLLRPLRHLNDGVTRLSAGEFDVVLPLERDDEFGRLTEAFNAMVRRVRAMVSARDQLLLDVSHELRSPLTRIKLALEFVPENAHRAGMADDVAEMERKIAELLELERLRAGKGVARVRRDVMPLVRAAVTRAGAAPPGARIATASGELWLCVDAEKFATVLRNLLENASKYALPDSKPVEVTVSETAERAVVRVSDDGVGIPQAARAQLFEPFFRVDPSRSKDTGGYGLGLSICKRIMEAHGGTIELEDRRQRGAAFVLTFPRGECGLE